ncbi:MFS transporter [Brumimicrobium oceani]|uniref:MFS transporter n=1 Tax=Brumimicrobium oceani TaxID=2100725 RepID=A0A2U2XFB3_9FLAO|nr:MFS transporter [Brumimicrobium oceani]PWH86492.1 MFS transporter [Brumimicrobium oceani]
MGYSKNFWALSLGMFFFMTSFNMIIPELNGFITSLGGEAYKGLIIGLFTITAALSRPFSGKMADTVGRKSTMYIGTFVSIIITLIYPLSGTIAFFLVLRFLHGFSTGFLPTGATALVTDLLPPEKRGQGMGVFGTGIALGLGVGQGLGTPIAQMFSINGLFIASSLMALISLVLIKSVKETLPEPQAFTISIFKIRIEDVFEKKVFPAAVVMFLTTICTGLILVLTPDKSVYLEIENKGWYYVFYVVSTIAVRLFSGRLSDKFGRRQTLVLGISFLIVAMLMTGYAKTELWYTSASFIFGIATGISSPTLFAWMADLSPAHRRGVGSGTLFIALELGILFGAISTLSIYENTAESLNKAFIFGAVVAGTALMYLVLHLLFSKTNIHYQSNSNKSKR